ncbi:MAG TPA: CoA transferase [Victivallales bacterium]|nr:CoA transferase [Victivallales bacterium]
MNNFNIKGPLDGLLVIDFTNVISGPFSTQLLSDNGARVIKIERKGLGDITRYCGVFIDKTLSKDFACVNGGKESFESDLKNPDDVKILKTMLKKADVLVENFRPGVMDRAGLGYEEVKRIKPDIIYASISGFGQTGPIHQAPAYDEIVQADSGFMNLTGFPDGKSTRAGCSLGDVSAGLYAYSGIMTALFARTKTGKGCHVDIAMLDSMIHLISEAVGEYYATGKSPVKHGNDNPSISPFSTFRVRDKEFVICVASKKLWELLLKAIGKEEWQNKPEFKFPKDLHKNREILRKELETVLKEYDAQYWIDKMHDAGVPCSNINTIEEMSKMEQVKYRKMIIRSGDCMFAGNPIKLSSYPVIEEREKASVLGEHNQKIIEEFSE